MIKCNGNLIHHLTPDDRDEYYCNKCGQKGRFDFDLKCDKEIILNLTEIPEPECEDCKTLGWTCSICDMRTYPIKESYDIQSILDSIIRYEKAGYDSGYIHIAIKERIKKELNIK